MGKRKAENPSIQKISLFNMEGSVTGMVFTMAVSPKTEPMLKIFEPIRFPKEIAFSCFAAAITEAANSGTLVPIAINDIPITASLTPIEIAMSLAPITSQSLPKYSDKPPITNHIIILKFETMAKLSSTSSTLLSFLIFLINTSRNKIRPANKIAPSSGDNLLSLRRKKYKATENSIITGQLSL